ncbi:glycosyltransferase family 4 protein [Bdellovibrio bacteriovorus]|uniref:Glycosyltransferase n=1 Tax=Bdellovibrio bacteriovorus str. Tiberius TaxID=1069642 RepID=K7YXC7_BDEBC|nr:glycosyltransferase family 4 protein [Bdellovibrio bacteriovorus]AFY01375.1 glycosyltransferase [Bdellovibrio bacteriovorus str. Tiberius]
MKVVFVNQFALRPTDRGSLRHFYLAQYLVSQGYQSEIVTSDIHYNSREKLVWNQSIEVHDGVTFKVIKGRRYSGQISRLFNHIQCAIKGFFYLVGSLRPGDVVVGSSPQPFLAFTSYLAAKVRRVRFIYEVRDLWPQTLIDLGGLSRSHPMVQVMFWIERLLARRSEKIVVLMPLAGLYFSEAHRIPVEKIIWVGQGVDTSVAVAKFSSALVESAPVDIVYAGSLGAANRMEFLLEVAGQLQLAKVNVHFSIYGDGPERKELEAMAMHLGLKNITFFGALARKQVLGKVAESDFAIALAHNSPLYKFGISFNKLFDYFLAKKPVIFIGDVARNPVTDADAGFVIPDGSPGEVAQEMIKIIGNTPEYLSSMGDRGYRFLVTNHDHKVTGQKFLNLISSQSGI